jgi:hypothetical protein
MKTFMITAALSVLSLGQVAEAQDGKSIRTQSQIAEQMMAALPTQDNYTETKVIVFSTANLRMIAMLPVKDENVEIPTLSAEKTAVAQAPVLAPDAPKAEVKATKIGER